MGHSCSYMQTGVAKAKHSKQSLTGEKSRRDFEKYKLLLLLLDLKIKGSRYHEGLHVEVIALLRGVILCAVLSF